MSVFVKSLLIELNSNYFSYSHDILKVQIYEQILQFQHQIKLKHENQASVTLDNGMCYCDYTHVQRFISFCF